MCALAFLYTRQQLAGQVVSAVEVGFYQFFKSTIFFCGYVAGQINACVVDKYKSAGANDAFVAG